MNIADLTVIDGLVMNWRTVPVGIPGENVVCEVEISDEFLEDWWPEKWAYDAQSGELTLSGIAKPEPEPWPEPPPSLNDKVTAIEGDILNSYLAQVELYEENLAIKAEQKTVMLALVEMYEMILMGGT